MPSKLFHKAFSNRSIITAGEGGITKPELQTYDEQKQKNKIVPQKISSPL